MTSTGARGIRNNNPGNLKDNAGNPWYGQIDVDRDGFCVFAQPWQGYRAMAKTIQTYQRLRLAADGSAIDTVSEIIARWAPAGPENPHQNNYIAMVRRRMGIEKGAHVDVEDYDTAHALLLAMSQFETGEDKPFGRLTASHIRRGLIEVGIKPDGHRTEQDDGALKATKGAAVGATAAAGLSIPAIADIAPAFPILTRVIEIAPWVLAVGASVLLAYGIWRIIRWHWHGV